MCRSSPRRSDAGRWWLMCASPRSIVDGHVPGAQLVAALARGRACHAICERRSTWRHLAAAGSPPVGRSVRGPHDVVEIVAIDTPSLGDRSYLVHDGAVAFVVDPQRDIDRDLGVVGRPRRAVDRRVRDAHPQRLRHRGFGAGQGHRCALSPERRRSGVLRSPSDRPGTGRGGG